VAQKPKIQFFLLKRFADPYLALQDIYQSLDIAFDSTLITAWCVILFLTYHLYVLFKQYIYLSSRILVLYAAKIRLPNENLFFKFIFLIVL
jgi:hypothetical protein